MMKRILILSILIQFGAFLLADETAGQKRVYRAEPTNPHPPVIDGRIDEESWGKSVDGTDFLQLEPHEGQPPSQPTVFKIVYDDKNLYIAIRAHDSEPDNIVRRVSRRDKGDNADLVSVLIDSYHDKRTAFEFTVNVAGVKIDGIWSEDGDFRDYSWDPVWYVETAVDEAGWTAEMCIPFSQLRFGANEEQVWGLEVGRYLYRKQEWSLWQFIPQESAGFVSQMGELQGIRNIPISRRIELLPYTLGQVEFSEKEDGNPFASGRDGKLSGGLDGKIGITSDLTLDFTVNPDFGQIEADPSEVNLTAFETFFAEKRPFFIEGKNIFDYPLGWGDGSFASEQLFYSRRIGRSPQYEPDLEDEEVGEFPENTSIISAAKVTGKTRKALSIGVVDAVTASEYARIDRDGQQRTVTVEPLTNYFAGRLQKDYHRGNTTLGGMVTATHRDLRDPQLNFLNRAAYSGGLDLSQQWHNKDYWFGAKTAFSRIEGDEEAIYEAQTASQRYFQRPDASHVSLDSTRTALNGHAGAFILGKVGGGHWRYVVSGIWRSPGFEINDLGFLREADRATAFTWIAYREWNPTWIFRHFQINFNLWNGWNFARERLFTGTNVNGGGQLKNYWSFWSGLNRDDAALSDNELRGGPMMKFPGAWNHWLEIFTDERKMLRFGFRSFNSFKDDHITRQHQFSLAITWQPGNALTLSAEPFYQFNRDNLQYITTETHESLNEDRYILGRIEQQTFGMQFRTNLSFTPNLSIQYYGQPFISAGTYSRFKRVTQPRSASYEQRFHTFTAEEITSTLDSDGNRIYQIDENSNGRVDYSFEDPTFNFFEFRSNLVVRWEYLPGSTLFLIWTQNRSDNASNGHFSLTDDLNTLFNIHPNNIFLIKLNYWFSI